MPDDLPAISEDLDTPLPQVDPESAMVPYRMSRTEPGGQPVVTTGWGPRARPPIQPPQGFGGGVGIPDLDQIYQAAFSKLPVEEAVKAAEAATRYVAQRGYQADLARGGDAMKTFAKWAPLLFKQATGLPEVFQAQMQLQKMNEPTIHAAGGGLYRVPRVGPAQPLVTPKPSAPSFHSVGGRLYRTTTEGEATPVTPEPPPKPAKVSEEEKDAYKQLDEARKDMAKLVATPPPKSKVKEHQKAMDDATMRMRDARQTIAKFKEPSPTTVTTKEQYDALASGTIYTGKDGKKYRKP